MAEIENVKGSWKETDRRQIPLAPEGVNTFGLKVEHITYKRDGGERKEYWKYSLPDVAQVLATTPDGKVITINEPRPKVGADYPHVIGETVEDGEPPLLAAIRGLVEETGYCPGRLVTRSELVEAVMSGQNQVLDRDVLTQVQEVLGVKAVHLSSVLHDTTRSDRQIHHYLLRDCEKIRPGEAEVKVRLMEVRELRSQLVTYMTTKSDEARAGVNSLVALTLAEDWLKTE